MYKKLIITQFTFYSKIPNLEERDKSQLGNLVGNSLIGICLTLPNLGFFYGYSLFFPVTKTSNNAINMMKKGQ